MDRKRDEVDELARRAVGDLVQFVRANPLPAGKPQITFDIDYEDGYANVGMQWTASERGILLIFSGDGHVNVSTGGPDRQYGLSGQTLPLREPIPADVMAYLNCSGF